MMSECVFCSGLEPRQIKKYEDCVKMITPLNPVVDGHKLFIHDVHTNDAAEDPHITGWVFRVAAQYASTQNKDFNLIVNGGVHAGQTVFHLHVHYVPRVKNDGLKLPWSDR